MQAHVVALRAIGTEYMDRFMKPALLLGAGILTAYVAIVTVLTIWFSAWWALLFVPVPLVLVVTLATWLAYKVSRGILAPKLARPERQAVREFVDTLQITAEQLRTPYFVIIFYILRDIMRKNDRGYLQSTITNSKSLTPMFQKLVKDIADSDAR